MAASARCLYRPLKLCLVLQGLKELLHSVLHSICCWAVKHDVPVKASTWQLADMELCPPHTRISILGDTIEDLLKECQCPILVLLGQSQFRMCTWICRQCRFDSMVSLQKALPWGSAALITEAACHSWKPSCRC